jgi:hypothetical protein
MTSELLNKGIDALKDINTLIMNFSDRDEENNHDVAQIQEDLSVLTDVLHQAFLDMVSVDDIKEKIRAMNETLDKHLNKFQ